MNRKEILKLIQAKELHIDEGVKLYTELVLNSTEEIHRNTCIIIESPGYVDDLKLVPVSPREPEADEIQIEVRAFSLNFGDLLCVKGLYPTMPPYPFTPGFEVAGIAVKVGKSVKRIKAGDPVISIMGPKMGGHSSNVTVSENWVVKKPDILSFEEACSLPITFLTVYHVFDAIKPQHGEKILIQTAAGGTGLIAVQLAMHAGAEIYATAGSDEKLEYLKNMGITNLINYREEDFYQKVMEMTDGSGVDVVLNTLSGEAIQKGINLLAPGGRYVEIAMTGLKSSTPVNMAHMVDNQSFFSVDLRKFLMKKQELATKYLDIMVEYVERGIVKPIINKVFKISEIKQAYKCLEDRRNIGKIVVSIPEQVSAMDEVKPDEEKPFKEYTAEDSKAMNIAVIGMSARFPRSPDINKFWENLAQGEDLITEIPGERWDWRDYYHPDLDNLVKTNSKWGGFLENPDLFDPSFFKISGREAEVTDPQQRIFLEECWNALEDAGYASDVIDSKRCGIFAGTGGGDYLTRLRENNVDRIPQSFWGNESSVIPARIAYFLNLKGPAVSINTACSSSLVAIHLALQSILAGDCDMALAGGIFLCTSPEFYILSSNANMLSPDGRCKAFDNSANGFVPGEGAGVIMLKRLDEALKDGDHIYGVIKGSSINQDGRTNGITAPNSLSQINLLTSVYEKFGINPETISYIEAHGTGTELGDPIEVGALTNAFGKFTSKKNYCWLGSVKTNIGHAVSAAGVAGVIKVMLALKHGCLPPILHFNEANKHISFEDTPFKINTKLQEWKSENGKPRRAGVSSFGFSGTNAHIVIEEPPEKINLVSAQNPYYFIPISAKSEQALKHYSENLYKWLESSNCSESIANIAYTLLMRRAHFPYRVALIARDTNDLMKKLHTLCSSNEEMNSHSNIWREKTNSNNQNLINYANNLINEINLCSINKNAISEKQYLEKLSTISEFYIKQYSVDWGNLYRGCGYSHISMPTYPFQRFSYWAPPVLKDINDVKSSLIPERASGSKDDMLAYYKPGWIEEPPLDSGWNKKQVKTICVFGGDDELYQAVRDRWDSLLIRVVPGDGFKKTDINTFVINSGKAEDYICLVNELKSEDKLPSDILYAWTGSSGMTQVNTGFDKLIGDELLEQFNSLVYLTKAFMKAASGWSLNLTYICRGNTSMLWPLTHGLTAFFRTLHTENTLYRFRSVQLPAVISKEKILDFIGYEMDTASTAGEEISYADGKRRVRRLVRYVPELMENKQAFKSKGVYWIVGGAGGIGIILVRYLVEKFDATVYISGRSDKPENIKEIKGKLFYIKGDVSEKGEAKRIYDRIISESGCLNGVINLAGVIRDKYLINKSIEDINAVLAPKCWGTYYLDEATANEKLDFFMVFSSIVSFTGNSGQSDYSFANGFIDGYMHMRNTLCSGGKRWGNSISINWPVWEEGGMKLTAQAGEDMKEVLGLHPLSALHGITALVKCIQIGLSQLLVIYGDSSKFENLFDDNLENNGKSAAVNDETDNYGECPDQAVLLKWVEDYLKNIFAGVLKMAPGSFEVYTPFEELGMDSLIVKNVNTKLEESLGTLPKTLLFERSNIKALAEYLVQNNSLQLLNAFNNEHRHEVTKAAGKIESISGTNIRYYTCDKHVEDEIAIIGMSARLPQAKDINEFWENLKTGKDCITEIPKDRWDYREYYHPDPELAEQGKMYCKWGGFIEDIRSFDTLFFNIPPQKAELMDPQERLLLQTSWLALEDCGYNPREFSKKYSVGVFVGVTTHSYQLWGPGEWQKGNYIFPESSAWSLANRISYFYDFKGPSIPVDTACSSSLTAVHEACASIKRGECEVALVGGVNLYLHPSKYIGLCQMRMLSKDGRCKSFAEGADGFVPGEGVAAVVLKPLSKAIKDKDNIYAVIKGSSVNHGGRTNGYTVPNPDSQAELICRAFEYGHIEPLSVTAIEAHGTGTALGDPIEIRGLNKAFGAAPEPYCSISSSKSNIGHLESAAGITGMIKMALQLKYKKLVPTLHAKKLNKDIPFEGSPFFIQKVLADWESQVFNAEDGVCEYPRRGGISSFGAGGANAHVILEEYTTLRESDEDAVPNDLFLVVLSAKTSEALSGNCKKLYKHLEKKTGSRQSVISGKEELYESLKVMAAEIIGVKPEDILPGELFEDLGMDTVSLNLLQDRINDAYNTGIKIDMLLKCKCLLEVTEEMYVRHLSMAGPNRADIPTLGDIAYTLQVGREHMEERVAFVVSSVEDLISRLKLFTSTGDDNNRIYWGNTSGYKASADNTDLQLLMENKDYHALARLWASGADIDWEAFNRDSKYRRVPLPGYSFAVEQYWIPAKSNETTDTSSGLNGPLSTNKPETREYKYAVELSRDEFYIKDHVVSGSAVMPASAYLNMVCSCFVKNNQAKVYKMNNLLWLKPLTFGGVIQGESCRKTVYINFRQEDRKTVYEVYSNDDGNPIIHHTGEISEEDASETLQTEFIDVKSVKAECHRRMDRMECYDILSRGGIIYGQSLCIIDEIYSGGKEAIALLKLPQFLCRDTFDFIIHPSIIDGALQSIIGIDLEDGSGPYIPFSIGEVKILKPLNDSVYVYINVNKSDSAYGSRLQKVNMIITDLSGEILVDIRNIALRELKQPEGKSNSMDFIFVENTWAPKELACNIQENHDERETLLLINAHGELYGLDSFKKVFFPTEKQAGGRNEDDLKILERLKAEGIFPDKIIIYAPDTTGIHDINNFMLENTYYFIRELIGALMQLKAGKEIRLLYIYNTDISLEAQPFYAGIGGFFKTLHQENPGFVCKTIGVEKHNQNNVDIYNEFFADSDEREILYAGGRRHIKEFKEIEPFGGSDRVSNLKKNGVYLITGGMGALGSSFANYLAGKLQAKLVLVGRTPFDESKREKIRHLEGLGSQAVYLQADLSVIEEVQYVFCKAKELFNSIDGIIHCAGVIKDSFIMKKTRGEMEDVFKSKALSALNIDAVTADEKLDFFLMFSSLAGVLGNPGQSDYAYSNCFLDAYAVYREKLRSEGMRYGRAISVQWPYWKDGGMPLSDEYIEGIREKTGMIPLPLEEGVEIINMIVSGSQSEIAVLYGDTQKIRGTFIGSTRNKPEEVNMKPQDTVVTKTQIIEKTEIMLKEILSEEIKLPVTRINSRDALQKYGIDSLLIVKINRKLEKYFGELSKTLLFEYQTLEELAVYLADNYSDRIMEISGLKNDAEISRQKFVEVVNSYKGDTLRIPASIEEIAAYEHTADNNGEIAIVGISGKYPMADDLESLWENLENGRDCITEIPKERWEYEKYFDPAKNKKGKTNSKWGGFINDFDSFDPLFFNITPGEAEWIDPQERLFMETVWHTLEDAGYTCQGLKEQAIGVFVGLMYAQYTLFETEVEGTSMYPVGSYASIANRVSYFFNFKGPSIALDTMCSSSLTSIHLACESIRRGECDAAVAGGVNITIHPNKHLHLSMGGFASSDGRCRSFGSGGDGYVPGEGVGAVFLKPLKKAVSDGDRIYGVIKGSFINHGGKTNGYTVPNPAAQTDLILNTLKRAKWNPDTISYIEAHGTGTSLGDPIEINSLTKAFRKYTSKKQFCSIGSIKSNIGHLESAAGIAAVSKVILMMKHKKLVPSIHSDTINENINFKDSPFYVQRELQEWEPIIADEGESDSLYLRRAAISAFGAGGSNAQILIEEYIPHSAVAGLSYNHSQPVLIFLSAKTKERLKEYAANLARFLKARENNTDEAYLASVAYTLQAGREAMEYRLAMTVLSLDELIEKLNGYVDANEMDGQFFTGSVSGENSRVSILVDGEEGRSYLQSLIENRRFDKLAQLWVCGVDVDWKSMYGNVHPPVTSIPGYPFAKGRYWVQPPSGCKKSEDSISPKLHPLIHTNTSTLRKQKFSSSFSGSEFFLEDHIVGGQKVLPGAVQIEMARVAGEIAGEGRVRGLKEVVWARPSTYNGSPMVIQTGISVNNDGEVLFEIAPDELGHQDIICKGGILFSEDNGVPLKVSIDEILNRCQGIISREKAYELFSGMGLNYGSCMQVLREVHYNQTEALSMLTLPDISNYDSDEIKFHLAIMDGAFQTIIGLMLSEESNDGHMYLPFSVGRVEFIRALTQRCYAYVVKKSNTGGSEIYFDIQIIDINGEVLLVFRDFQLKPVNNGGQLMYFHREWQQEEIQLDNEELIIGSEALVFDVGGQLKNVLGENVPENPMFSPIYITHGKSYEKYGDRAYQIDFANEQDYISMLTDLKKSGKYIKNIVYYNAKRGSSIAGEEFINNELNENLLCQIYLLKAMGNEFKNETGYLYVYRSGNNLSHVFQAGVKGLAQAVRLEKNNLQYKTLMVDQAYPVEQMPGIIAKEIKSAGKGAVNIAYKGGKRLVETIKEDNVTENYLGNIPFKQGGVYWITGGLGSLGMIIAHYLAKKFKARIILSGRSELTPEAQKKLDGLLAAGTEVIYCKGDISNPESTYGIYKDIKRRFGKLDGIVHSAGITNDSLIINKDIEKVREVLAPKILGTINLDEVTKAEGLDVFVMFSSITGVLGNYGQTDYAYANVFIDNFAGYREYLAAQGERKGRTISVVWPFWKEGSMKASKVVLTAMQKELGIYPLSTDMGVKALEYALSQEKNDHTIVAQGNSSILRKKIGNACRYKQKPLNSEIGEGNVISNDLVSAFLKKVIIEETKLENTHIKPDEVWTNLGIDSTVNLRLLASLERSFGELPKTLFFEYTNLNNLTEYFINHHGAKLKELLSIPKAPGSEHMKAANSEYVSKTTVEPYIPEFPAHRNLYNSNRFAGFNIKNERQTKEIPDGIAIIGISGRYPKAANLEEFWENLKKGEDCISEIPADRWDNNRYFNSQKGKPGKSYSKWGGFLGNVDRFDPLFFKISPREAASMDPQQRLFLETAWHTIEDAGYPAAKLRGKQVGVFVGVMYGQYQLFGSEETVKESGIVLDSSFASVSNRVSYFFDFKGPSIAVDTMCSSSLTSVHLACQSIRMGECEMALAGGVNLTIHPSKYINLSQGKFVSSEGLCRSFGMGGDGYVPGEGVGAVLLKPLKKAVEDGDMIYAVIRGSSVNHGGKSSGYTVPNPSAQAEVIDMGLRTAGWEPETISYLEAHGTGTSLGDPVEIKALAEVFGTSHTGKKCPIGSVKSNIGHLESAAGIAGLTKVILMIKNKTLVKSLHSETLNPYIDFDNIPFYVQRNLEKWEQADKSIPLRAGVSSFGAGGANAHILIEGYDDETLPNIIEHFRKQVVVISARNLVSVKAYAGKLAEFLSKEMQNAGCDSKTFLCNAAFTLHTSREEMESRLAVTAEDMPELIEKLKLFGKGIDGIKGVYTGTALMDNNDMPHEIDKSIFDAENAAQQWVSGKHIDWRLLHKGYEPRKISLPGYEFEQKRCWFDTFTAQTPTEEKEVYEIKPVKREDSQQFDHSQTQKTSDNKIILKNLQHKEAAMQEAISNLTVGRLETTVSIPDVKTAGEGKRLISATLCPDIRREIENAMMDVLYLNKEDIDSASKFTNLGMDSVLAIELAKRLSKALCTEVKTVDLYEYNTVDLLANKLQSIMEPQIEGTAVTEETEIYYPDKTDADSGYINRSEKQSVEMPGLKTDKQQNTCNQEDIAIIGVSGRYPMAENIDGYWENLKQGKNCIEEIPPERWNYKASYDMDGQKDGKIPSKWGGFIKDIDKFDPLLFNISPREAIILDPQVRIMLELVWEALEDAGYSRTELQKAVENGQNHKIGVFAGSMYLQYPWVAEDMNVGSLLSNSSYWSIANRISYFFNFRGPSIAVDTACSSSMTAIHLACESIRNGGCTVAVAGGVNLSLIPNKYAGISQMGMLSSKSESRGLGDSDGYIPGEGAGIVLLKPVSRAIMDRDHIYAVIKGSGISHNGQTEGFTIPDADAQAALIIETLEKSGVNPRTISCMELSMTGSPTGDATEFEGIRKAFQRYTMDTGFCSIGTVKSNIGHVEACSGIAQLTKVLLQLYNRQLAPTINWQPLNPKIRLEGSPFYIQKDLQPWKQGVMEINGEAVEYPFRASINSFGAGGANAHVILEEYRNPIAYAQKDEQVLIVLSARKKESLDKLVIRMRDFFLQRRDISLSDAAFTLQVGREAMEERLAIITDGWDDLLNKLEEVIDGSSGIQNVFRTSVKPDAKQNVFLDSTVYAAEMINNWVSNGNLIKIAELWTKGIYIDWNLIPQNKNCKRLPMPKYPFERNSYWLGEDKQSVQTIEKNDDGIMFAQVKSIFSQLINLPVDEIDESIELKRYGFDSLIGMRFINHIREKLGIEVPVSKVLTTSTLHGISQFINRQIMSKDIPDEDLSKLLDKLETGEVTPYEAMSKYKNI